jgi:hypothetical protein
MHISHSIRKNLCNVQFKKAGDFGRLGGADQTNTISHKRLVDALQHLSTMPAAYSKVFTNLKVTIHFSRRRVFIDVRLNPLFWVVDIDPEFHARNIEKLGRVPRNWQHFDWRVRERGQPHDGAFSLF